jgi:hypothetical protein
MDKKFVKQDYGSIPATQIILASQLFGGVFISWH